MELVGHPADRPPDDPIVRLWEALVRIRKLGGSYRQQRILGVANKAMNAFLAGRSMKTLRYEVDKEKFPRIVGGRDCLSAALSRRPGDTHGARDDGSNIKVRLVNISPEVAHEMLNACKSERRYNRNVSQSVVAKYARDMEEGRWHFNGETIKVGADGRLLDGQHRLKAIIKSDRTIQALVVDGLKDDVVHSLDIGRKRSTSDILREMGESNTNILASALRWYWTIDGGIAPSRAVSPSTGELLSTLQGNPEIRDSIRFVSSIRKFSSVSIAAAMHLHFARTDREEADRFYSGLISGADLPGGGALLRLRDELSGIGLPHRSHLTDAERVTRTMRAWAAFIGSSPPKKTALHRYPSGSAAPEAHMRL